MKINIKKIFNTIMLCLFLIFISLFYASNSGYYEYQNKNKMILTQDKIKQFEKDLKDGKNVDIKTYLSYDKYDYSNKITKFGNKLSDIIDYSIIDGLEKTFNFFEKFIE